MNKQTEALKMAIEYIEGGGGWGNASKNVIQACKEALEQDEINLNCKSVQKRLATQWGYVEQPAQEPVAWNEEEFNAIAYAYRSCPAHEVKMVSERYQDLVDYVLSIANPAPSWQGLSDDEISKVISDEQIPVRTGKTANRFARAIEQALRNKNGY